MVIPAPRSVKIGTIIDKTLGVMEHGAVAALAYVVGLTAINAAVTYFSLDMTTPTDRLVIWLGQLVVGIVAAYLLIDALVRKTGLRSRTQQEVFPPYFALSILYTLGVIAGLILFILPGLLFMARWSIAQPILVARGDSPMKALGESWERTSGAEFQILVAVLALLVLPVAILIACGILFDPADPLGIVVTQLATSATSLVSLAAGVALYGLIGGATGAAGPAA